MSIKPEVTEQNKTTTIGKMDFIPGGRILRNARKGSSAKYLTSGMRF